MKTLSILASVMVVVFLAVPDKVQAQRTARVSSITPTKAQKAPDCKIAKIKIAPFDSLKGTFGQEIEPNLNPDFINEFHISLFVVVEISSQTYFEEISLSEANKDIKVEIIVTEGKRQKAKKIEQIGLSDLSNGGRIYVPLWLDPLMCGDVKINARIVGQKSVSTMERTVQFSCGE